MTTVGPAGPDDAAAITALRREWSARDGRGPGTPAFDDRMAAWLRDTDRLILVARSAGEIVGMINVAWFTGMPWPDGDDSRWAHLANLYVRAGERRRGTGRALLDRAVAEARAAGMRRVVLRATADSAPLCRRAGFRPDGSWLVLEPVA